jgi:5-methylthioadenosine/S-adenosylhomocysteine deaminase
MNNRNEILNSCDIGIEKGIITKIGKSLKGDAEKIIDGTDKYVLPGFVNCHTHVYQSLIEGIGYDMHFNPWNIRYLIPIISNMNPDHAGVSGELAALEMIKSGTTSFSDHWYLHTDFDNIEAVTEAFDSSGLRNHIVFGFLNESFAGRKNSGGADGVLKEDNELLKRAEDFVRRRQGWNLTTTGLGPGSTEDVGTDLFKRIINLGRELDVTLVTHIAGWVEIVSRSLEKYRLRDLEYAHSLGFTGEKSIALHGVWLSDDEIQLAADTGTKIVHNPVANMHLGYGVAPVTQMLKAGIKVGLGTDGAASYTYDMLEIGKTAAMLQKAVKMDAEALTAEKALQMLTIDGAGVLGLEKSTGSIEVGKQADIIIMETNSPHILRGGRPVPKIVYSARGNDVVTSIVNGKIIMEDRVVLTMNEEAVITRSNEYRAELIEKGGAATAELLKAPWPEKGASWRNVNG